MRTEIIQIIRALKAGDQEKAEKYSKQFTINAEKFKDPDQIRFAKRVSNAVYGLDDQGLFACMDNMAVDWASEDSFPCLSNIGMPIKDMVEPGPVQKKDHSEKFQKLENDPELKKAFDFVQKAIDDRIDSEVSNKQLAIWLWEQDEELRKCSKYGKGTIISGTIPEPMPESLNRIYPKSLLPLRKK